MGKSNPAQKMQVIPSFQYYHKGRKNPLQLIISIKYFWSQLHVLQTYHGLVPNTQLQEQQASASKQGLRVDTTFIVVLQNVSA